MSEFEGLMPEDLGLAAEDVGPLSDEEHQAMTELLAPPEEVRAAVEIADLPVGAELALLGPMDVPVVGVHYVICDRRPMPVLKGSYAVSEDDHVRSQLPSEMEGVRRERAEAHARWRYRAFLCGEVSGL